MERLTSLPLIATLVGMATGSQAAGLEPAQRADLFAYVPPAKVKADTDGDRVFDNLEARLQAGSGEQAVPVIVRYKPGQRPASIQAAKGVKQLPLDNSVVLSLTKAQVERLATSGAVESIEADGRCWKTRDTAMASFGAAKAVADFGLTGDGDGDPTGYSARDLTIAVIDTGIDASHPDFAGGKVIAWKDWVHGRPRPYDDDGHGTHVASIAAGAVNAQGEGGVAPGASIVALKVLGENGGTDSDISQSVEWCIQNRARYGIDVINMSLGGEGSSDGRDVISRSVNRAVAAGLVVCVAAGNEGSGSFTVSSPGAAADALTVGNMIDLGKGGFALAPSSSRGPTADGRVKPDLCAPGWQIRAAQANTGGYTRMTGTSMASPFVAGVAALMLQADPTLTPAQIKAIMKGTAVHFGRPGENTEFGAGRLDAYAALARVTGRRGTGPAVPAHLFGAGRLAQEGARQSWNLPIHDTRFPVALTLIIETRGADFDIAVFDPAGVKVVEAAGDQRQELMGFWPQKTGVYTVVVWSYAGIGDYTLDVSAGSGAQVTE
jgi:serine protease AprX